MTFKKFTYGQEVLDYFQCRLIEDGDNLSDIFSTHHLRDHGEVVAELPSQIDPAKLYKFRTDVFWGWPVAPDQEITERLVNFLVAFLDGGDNRILSCESWLDNIPAWESQDQEHFSCFSTREAGLRRFYRFLRSGKSNKETVCRFLEHNNTYPLMLIDLSTRSDVAEVIGCCTDATPEILRTLADNSIYVIVPAYDGRANLIWHRMSAQELRRRREAGNVEIA